MSSAPQGLAPREGLEFELMKLGRTGPPLEPRRSRQASLGTPVPRMPTTYAYSLLFCKVSIKRENVGSWDSGLEKLRRATYSAQLQMS